jgi:hypothetical protein
MCWTAPEADSCERLSSTSLVMRLYVVRGFEFLGIQRELIALLLNCRVNVLFIFHITESPIVLSPVHISQEMLYGTALLALGAVGGGGVERGATPPRVHHRCLLLPLHNFPTHTHTHTHTHTTHTHTFPPFPPLLIKYHVIVLK